MNAPNEPGSPLRIVAREIRAAPRRLRFILLATALYMVAMISWAVEKRGWASLTAPESLGAWMGAASGLVTGLSLGLYALAQGHSALVFGRIRTTRMHPMLLALPTLLLVAAALASASLAVILPQASDRPAMWLAILPTGLVLWFALQAMYSSTRFLYRQAEEQAAAAAEARDRETRARLATLQAQLNPHFLFNALNTVASLVRTDPRRAEHTVENLARILRRTLDRSTRTTIPLSDELDYTRAWLAIEQERHGDRLRVEWDVDPASLDTAVPPMTLQPIVENSLKHGLAKRLDGGTVRIRTERANGRLRLEVCDDGPGFERDWQDGTGLGNLRRRLDVMYAGAAGLHVDQQHGARVRIDLPAGA